MSVCLCGEVVGFFHLTMLQIKESCNRLCTQENRKTKISLHKALFLSSPVEDWPPSVLVVLFCFVFSHAKLLNQSEKASCTPCPCDHCRTFPLRVNIVCTYPAFQHGTDSCSIKCPCMATSREPLVFQPPQPGQANIPQFKLYHASRPISKPYSFKLGFHVCRQNSITLNRADT